MPDIHWVTERLAFGAAPESLYDSKAIAKQGVTHVINLREGDKNPKHVTDEIPWWKASKITLLCNGTHDDGEKKSADWFKRSIDFVLDALSEPGRKVFVHCREGHNRSPSTVYSALRAFGLDKKCAADMVGGASDQATMIYNKDADAAVKALGFE